MSSAQPIARWVLGRAGQSAQDAVEVESSTARVRFCGLQNQVAIRAVQPQKASFAMLGLANRRALSALGVLGVHARSVANGRDRFQLDMLRGRDPCLQK